MEGGEAGGVVRSNGILGMYGILRSLGDNGLLPSASFPVPISPSLVSS